MVLQPEKVSTSGSSVGTLTALPEFQTFEEMATKKDFDLLRRLEGIYEETIKTGCRFPADAFGGHCLKSQKHTEELRSPLSVGSCSEN